MTSLVIAAHGTRLAEGQQASRVLVDRVRRMLNGVIVYDSYVELDEPSISTAVAQALESDPDRRVVVVPLMIGTGGHVREDIPEAMKAGSAAGGRVIYTPHLGPDPRLRQVVGDRIAQALGDWDPGEATVVFLGRGSSVTDANADHVRLGRQLVEEAGYRDLVSGFIQVARPDLPAALDRAYATGARRIVVMPHYLFPGRLQHWAQRQTATWIESHLDAEVRVADVIGPCDELAAVVVDRYLAAAGRGDAPQLYLSALDLRGRRVVVAGAGRHATRRVDKLLDAGAEVVFVAPQASERIAELAAEGRVTWQPRPIEAADLDDAWYSLAETDSPEVNARVAEWAEARRCWCVRADDATGGTAWTPATGEANGLLVGVVGDRDPHRSAHARTAAVEFLTSQRG